MFKKLLVLLSLFYAALSFAAVDVNTASAADLDSVKGIGPGMSKRIINERAKGQFKDWGDFIARVKGLGEKNAANFSAGGMTVNGAGYAGAPAKPAKDAKAKKEKTVAAAPAAGATPAAAGTTAAIPAIAPKPAAPAMPAAPAAPAGTDRAASPASAATTTSLAEGRPSGLFFVMSFSRMGNSDGRRNQGHQFLQPDVGRTFRFGP